MSISQLSPVLSNTCRNGDGAARLWRGDGGDVEGGAVLVDRPAASTAARGGLVADGQFFGRSEQCLDAVYGPENKRKCCGKWTCGKRLEITKKRFLFLLRSGLVSRDNIMLVLY